MQKISQILFLGLAGAIVTTCAAQALQTRAAKKECHVYQVPGKSVRSTALSNNHLAVGCEDGTIQVWDTAEDESVGELSGHRNRVLAMVFSPDGKLLATVSNDQSVRIWHVEALECLHTCQLLRDWGTLLAWSPNSKKLAIGTVDDSVIVWDRPRLKRINKPKAEKNEKREDRDQVKSKN